MSDATCQHCWHKTSPSPPPGYREFYEQVVCCRCGMTETRNHGPYVPMIPIPMPFTGG